MFERYTERARRVVFFARYEASQFGCSLIDIDHLLLGLVREEKHLYRWVPKIDTTTLRKRIEDRITKAPSISTSIDLPLSAAARQTLANAATEADRLNHRYIGTHHLFLALAEDRSSFVGKLLHECGADPPKLREQITEIGEQNWVEFSRATPVKRPRAGFGTIEIHGTPRNTDYIRDVVSTVRSYNYHWHKTAWQPRDIVIHREDGTFSFDLSLAGSSSFNLVREGWKKDHCFICHWELFESDDEHGTGYTNGRSWLCVECCERFILGDFFSSSYSEFT